MSVSREDEGSRSLLERCFYSEASGPEGRRLTRQQTLWSLACALSYVAATWLLRMEGPHAAWIDALLVTVPILLAFATLYSFLLVLRSADEMIRKIQLEAMAVGFGVMIFVGLGYTLLEAAGAAPLNLNYLVSAGVVSWAVAVPVIQGHHR